MEPERQSALLQVKLGALVRGAFGITDGAPSPFPGGAALLADGAAYVLVDGHARSIGPALAWADRHGAAALHVITEQGAGRLARQAGRFEPAPLVWRADGSSLLTADAEPLVEPDPPPDAPQQAALLAAAGLDVVVEPGRLAGELRGLEVARVIAGATAADGPELEVGVGQADRELTAMLHGALSPEDALARVVGLVDEHRRPGAEPHPLNLLAPERWLRWVVRGEPGLVGALALEPTQSPIPRHGLRDRDVACAVGKATDGEPMVAVCSVGIDVDLVPLAAEARAVAGDDAELVLVVPDKDVHQVTHRMAARLHRPARIVALPGDWRTR